MPGQLVPEAGDQRVAPAAERSHHPLDLGLDLLVGERRGRRELRGMVGAGRGVRLEVGHRLGDVRRRQRAADAPAGHRVRLAGAVHDHRALEQLVGKIEHRGRRAGPVMDHAVDLVRDDPDVVLLGPLSDGLQLRQRVHRAGGIAWRAEDQPLGALGRRAVEVLHAHLETPVERAGHHHRLRAREVHDLGVRDPGRRRNQHLVGLAEQGVADIEERLLGPRADDDVVGIHRAAAREPDIRWAMAARRSARPMFGG